MMIRRDARGGNSGMDIRQMQYFSCLAQEGNVTRAARRLNIVQPGLSMQIAKLEKSVGHKLFERVAQGMSLTPAGEKLLQIVDPILKDIDHAREAMAQLDGKVSGQVNIGMMRGARMEHPAGEADEVALRVDFDCRLKLEFHSGRITSAAGLLAYRELDDIFDRF